MFFMKRLTLSFLLTFLLATTYTALAQVGHFEVSAPDSLDGDYNYIALPNGWGTPATGLCGNVVLAADSLGANLGCNPSVVSLTGKIALVFRGTCGFAVKVLNAQNAGAIGVLIANSATGVVPGALADGGLGPQITIPSALISNADGLKLRAALTAGATITGCMSLPDVPVSFLVDLSGITVDPAGVFVGYTVEGGAPQASPLTSLGNGLYTDTIYVPATSQVGFVFVNGVTQAGIEVLPLGGCGLNTVGTDSTGYVRYIYAGVAGANADKVCFGKCTRCQTTVTFRVDMKQKAIPVTGVHIAGNFQGYNPASTPLVNLGDSIYIYTLIAAPGDTLLYKFINGNTFNDDERAITAECGAPNGFGGFNRIYVVPNEDEVVLPAVCFDSCGPCPLAGLVCDSAAIICDDFDSYTLGGLNAQSADWDVWDGTGGDGIVTNEQAQSGSQSMKIDFALPGAQQDVVLLLGDSTSGNYLLKWQMFIPAGKQAYYNIQHDLTPHVFGTQVYFDANGAGRVVLNTAAGSPPLATFHYQYDKWIDVQQYIDIDNDVSYLVISDTVVAMWQFSLTNVEGTTSNQLAGVDFYPDNASYKYYVDNVQFIQLDAGAENDFCISAADIDSLFGQAIGQVISSDLYDNTNASTVGDPENGYDCFGEPSGNGADPSLENSIWFSFVGDGNRYFIETGDCGSTNYINDGDTQIAIYEGTCGNLVPVLCNEDGPSATGTLYPAGDTLQTVAGKNYFMLVDGFFLQLAAGTALSEGEFCIKVKRVMNLVGSNDPVFGQSIRLAPNPTNGVTNLLVSLPEAADLMIRVTNSLGQQVMQRTENNIQESTVRLDMSSYAKGVYFVELTDGTTRRLVVE